MIEYIKALIMGVIVGITSPLPVSSSAHYYFANSLLGFSQDGNTLAFNYSLFTLAFSIVIMVNFKNMYTKTASSVKKKQKSYKQRLRNILMSFPVGIILFIPLGKNGSAIDYFDRFLTTDSFLNPVLVTAASVISGLFLLVSFWYSKQGYSKGKKDVSSKSFLRMNLYTLPAYVIPGLSKVSLASVNLLICDVLPSAALREVYFYLAPQMFVISLIKVIKSLYSGIEFDPIALFIGIVAAALANFLILNLLRKTNVKKLLVVFSVYSILFGVAVTVKAFLI